MEERGISRRGHYLAVDCRGADIRMWSERARAFAVACLENDLNRVLIDAADSDSDGYSAVRDAMTTLILAGIPHGFRLAVVTNVPRLHALFVDVQRDLLRLGVPARCFSEETRALEWLLATPAARDSSARSDARPEA
jgi:hypothetical protein